MKFSRSSINCESDPGLHDSSVAQMRFGRNTVDRSQSVVKGTQSDTEDGKPMDEALEEPALFDFRRASRAAKYCSRRKVRIHFIPLQSSASNPSIHSFSFHGGAVVRRSSQAARASARSMTS